MNVCKGICKNFETANFTRGFSFLGKGWKKCRTCCISIKVEGYKCPCCKRKLSTYIRHKNKMKFDKIKN